MDDTHLQHPSLWRYMYLYGNYIYHNRECSQVHLLGMDILSNFNIRVLSLHNYRVLEYSEK